MMISRRRFFALTSGFAASIFGFGSYAFAIEPAFRLKLTSYRIKPTNWQNGPKLRIAALSDIHASEPHMSAARIREIVARTNDLGADIIVLLGDYVYAKSIQWRKLRNEEWAVELAALKAPLGVHAVLGNHDWWEYADNPRAGADEVRHALESAGINVLENDALRLVKDEKPFWLMGLTDQLAYHISRTPHIGGADDLPGTLKKLTDDAPAILLAHEPDIFVRVPDRVTLTLAGHTHGGQIRLFGWSPIIPSDYGNRFAYGHIQEGQRHMVVSAGLGTSKLPIRIGIPPEIVLIELG